MRSRQILIVCDEPETRIFLSNLLGSSGFSAVEAENEAAGMHLAESDPPALILLDMMLPREGGMVMYRFLKQHDRLRRIPVVILTAIDPERFFSLRHPEGRPSSFFLPNPEASLEKPIETERLLRLVRKLTRSRTRRPSKQPRQEA
jgi:two-component system phosphate regulon response regulator PhoB